MAHVLAWDQPVGTGFAFTNSEVSHPLKGSSAARSQLHVLATARPQSDAAHAYINTPRLPGLLCMLRPTHPHGPGMAHARPRHGPGTSPRPPTLAVVSRSQHGYVRSMPQMAAQLLVGLRQFFALHPQYATSRELWPVEHDAQ